ncbi:MAG TPA: hypothetical protein VIJ18_01945, partial [Microbacteriaceae bacterium]
ERVIPRGHFHEVFLQRPDALLRAYVSGDVPALGSTGFASITKAMTFRDDILITETAEGAGNSV